MEFDIAEHGIHDVNVIGLSMEGTKRKLTVDWRHHCDVDGVRHC